MRHSMRSPDGKSLKCSKTVYLGDMNWWVTEFVLAVGNWSPGNATLMEQPQKKDKCSHIIRSKAKLHNLLYYSLL